MAEWSIVRTSQPTFSLIRREHATHGKIYTLWQDEHTCWVSQSIPALVEAVNALLPKVRRLHNSGLYCVLRHENARGYHKFFRVRKWIREDTVSLNEFLVQYQEVLFVTKEATAWRLVKNSATTRPPSPGETFLAP
jgi:hypothetical protein